MGIDISKTDGNGNSKNQGKRNMMAMAIARPWAIAMAM